MRKPLLKNNGDLQNLSTKEKGNKGPAFQQTKWMTTDNEKYCEDQLLPEYSTGENERPLDKLDNDYISFLNSKSEDQFLPWKTNDK